MMLYIYDVILFSQLPNQVITLILSVITEKQISTIPAELGYVLSFHPGGPAVS